MVRSFPPVQERYTVERLVRKYQFNISKVDPFQEVKIPTHMNLSQVDLLDPIRGEGFQE